MKPELRFRAELLCLFHLKKRSKFGPIYHFQIIEKTRAEKKAPLIVIIK